MQGQAPRPGIGSGGALGRLDWRAFFWFYLVWSYYNGCHYTTTPTTTTGLLRLPTFFIHLVWMISKEARSVRSKQMMAARAPRQ